MFFDRLSGLWVLCVLSLLAALIALALHRSSLPGGFGWYVLLLVAVIVAPLLPWPTAPLHRVPLALAKTLATRATPLGRLTVRR